MIQNVEIYNGSRGEDFRTLIRSVLQRGRLLPKYLNALTDDESMRYYGRAFTALTSDPENNSEIFEQLGDVSANTFIVWYMYRRFPQLDCTKGVKVVARLRINYGSKQSFFNIANKLGFWPFISASDEERSRRKKPLLEDCLEAFFGATQYLLDRKFRPGVGYAIVYDILTNIFDEIPISLKYDDLYDAKTRLKEVFDFYKDKLGTLLYVETKDDMITTSTVYRIKNGENTKNNSKLLEGFQKWVENNIDHEHRHKNLNKEYETDLLADIKYYSNLFLTGNRNVKRYFLGEGRASLKSDAQQRAAANALENLQKQGYKKDPDEIYTYFCD